MLDFTQCDWIDLTKLTRYHQNLMTFLSDNYLNKSGGTMNGQINSCSILPKSPSSYTLGSSTNQWSNIYSNGFVLIDSTGQIRPNSTGTGNLGTSRYYWGNAYINNITSGTIIPKTDNTYDLGSSTYKFKDAYINNLHGTVDEIASTALSMPTGAILRLSAKGCTTASIAQDNGVVDVSGNGNHGQAYDGVSVVFDEDLGNCFDFNGTTQVIKLTDRKNTVFISQNAYTFVARFKLLSKPTKSSATVIFWCNTTPRIIISLSKDYKFRIMSDNGFNDIIINKVAEIGVVYNVIVSVNYLEGWRKVYIDGVEVASETKTGGALTININYLWVGNGSGINEYFVGRVSDARIYPYALTPTQVKSLYMFPDEALFAQLTADLIGANVIKAKNLIKTEAVITETAQISQAIVKDLVVTNGVTIGDLNTTAQNANNKIDNLQVGGVNRFKSVHGSGNSASSADLKSVVLYYGKAGLIDTYFYIKLYEDMIGGNKYTLSCFAEGFASDNDYVKFCLWNSASDRFAIKIQNGKCSLTFTPDNNVTAGSAILVDDWLRNISEARNVTLSNFKIEKGNMATDYSPAPEDTDSLIATAQGKADSAYSNNQATQTQLDNLQVGGRNLLLKDSTWTVYNPATHGNITEQNGNLKLKFQNTVSSEQINFSNNKTRKIANRKETISFYLKVDDNIPQNKPFTFNGTLYLNRKETYDNTTGRFTVSYTSSDTRAYIIEIWFMNNNIDMTSVHTFELTNIKFEEGEKATTWTPAPEDVDADISTAQTTANTAVSNAATAQSGVNTLNEIIMPNGEIFSLTADNYNTDTTILDDDIGFQNSLQNMDASNPVTLKLDKEQGCYIEFVQDETNSKFQSMYELLNRHQNAYFITDVTDLNANGYTIWTRVRLRDLTVHTDSSDIYAGIFCLGNYGNHGISLRSNNTIYASINFPSVSADTVGWGFSDYVNKWVDICFTADSVNAETRKIKLYLNGVLKENKTTTTQITSGQASSVIARGGGSHNSGFANMDFKAAKVWNRPLTAGEVAGLTKYFNSTGSATAKNINNAQTTANTAVTNLNNINLMTTASVDALFNLTSATNA